jgi:hypothetical protein
MAFQEKGFTPVVPDRDSLSSIDSTPQLKEAVDRKISKPVHRSPHGFQKDRGRNQNS